MSSALRAELGSDFEVPTGGTSMWVPLPPGMDADRVAAEAARRGILVESSWPFFLSEHPLSRSYLRLAYAAIPVRRVTAGVQALFEVVHELA